MQSRLLMVCSSLVGRDFPHSSEVTHRKSPGEFEDKDAGAIAAKTHSKERISAFMVQTCGDGGQTWFA